MRIRPSSGNLGDMWASICYAIRKSAATKEKVEFWVPNWEYDQAVEILNLLDLEDVDAEIEICAATNDLHASPVWSLPPLGYCEAFDTEYLPTKLRWNDEKSRIICYQFDPGSKPMSKSCDLNSISILFQELEYTRRYRLVDLGHRCPLQAAVHLLSIAEAFIGVESGLAHVAYSVGTPAFVLTNWAPPHWALGCCHKNKPVVTYRNAHALLKHDTWLTDFKENIGKIIEPPDEVCPGCYRSYEHHPKPEPSSDTACETTSGDTSHH